MAAPWSRRRKAPSAITRPTATAVELQALRGNVRSPYAACRLEKNTLIPECSVTLDGRGDQHIIINVDIPTKLSKEQRELFEKLALSLGTTPKPQEKGFFDLIGHPNKIGHHCTRCYCEDVFLVISISRFQANAVQTDTF